MASTSAAFLSYCMLPWGFELDVRGSFANTRYLQHNLIHFLNTNTLRRRRDRTQQLRVAIKRPVTEHISLEATWTGIDQYSSVNTFNYTRQIMGLYVRTEFP